VIEYAVFLHGLAQQWRVWQKRNLAHGLPRGWGWCPNVKYVHSACKHRESTWYHTIWWKG